MALAGQEVGRRTLATSYSHTLAELRADGGSALVGEGPGLSSRLLEIVVSHRER